MAINKTLEKVVNNQIQHSQAIGQYQRAQQTMLAQINRVAMHDMTPNNVDEWLSAIESTIKTLNKCAIELDKKYEGKTW